MKRIFFLLFLSPVLAAAQQTGPGIQFEQDSWEQVKAKAKSSNKFIFVDAYTTWCGPCKFMSATIFPRPEVGDFFNKRFVNLKVQLDTTKQDNEFVKSGYADARRLQTDYKIYSFPTYLFFDPQGNLVHRAIGSMDATEFLEKAEQALRPETQYYTLLRQYKEGKLEPQFVHNFVVAATAAGDNLAAAKAFDQYLSAQSEPFTKETVRLMDLISQNTKSKSFQLILAHPGKYDSLLNRPGAARQKILNIVWQQEVFPALMMAFKLDFAKLEASLAAKYPGYAAEITAKSKATFYLLQEDWKNFQPAITEYIARYGSNTPHSELNEYAWVVFETSHDKPLLEQALEWSKRSIQMQENPMYIDTYANLLYKLGQTEQAIQWQEKAVALSAVADQEGYNETLRKMKQKQPTWKK